MGMLKEGCVVGLLGSSPVSYPFAGLLLRQPEARIPGQFYPPAQLGPPIPGTATVVSTGWPPTSAGLHVTDLSEHKTALCCWPRSHLITHSHFSMWPLFFLIPVTPGLCCSSNMAVCISLRAVHSQPFLSLAVTLPAHTQSRFPQGTWHHLSVSGFSHWSWAMSVVGLCPHYSEFREGRHQW